MTKDAEDRVPRHLVAGPYRYEVGFDGQSAFDRQEFGVCIYRSRRIRLDPLQSDTELPQTLMHEALHALGEANEIPEWDRHKLDDKGQHTDKINIMASVLVQFIRANPEFVAWVQTQK